MGVPSLTNNMRDQYLIMLGHRHIQSASAALCAFLMNLGVQMMPYNYAGYDPDIHRAIS